MVPRKEEELPGGSLVATAKPMAAWCREKGNTKGTLTLLVKLHCCVAENTLKNVFLRVDIPK